MSNYSDAIDLLNPVHYWRLEGNSNDTGTGTTLNGTDTAMEYDDTLVVSGVSSGASFNLDGSIAIATSTDLDNMTVTNRTISLWIRPTLDTLTFNLINIGDTTNGIYLSMTAGLLPMVGVVTTSTSSVHYGTSMRIDEPIHLLLEYSVGRLRLWQDGVLSIDSSVKTSIAASTGGTRIGKGESIRVSGGLFTQYDLHSKMSNLAIWNSTLTSSEQMDILYGSGKTEVVRNVNFFNIPDKTEIRMYDIDDSLNELGGIEFAGGAAGDEVDIPFTALTQLNTRIGIVNVEEKLETFYIDTYLKRLDVNIDTGLILYYDRNYWNPGWTQPIPVENITPPYITGVAKPNSGLTVNQGSWAGSGVLTYEYQWYRDGSIITGETGTTYTVQASDEGLPLFCRETASNDVPSSGTSDTGTRTYIDTKIFGIWESSSASSGQSPSVSWVDVEFDTEIQNINSEFGTSDNKTFTMPAGSYLVIATMKYEDTSNGRVCPEGKIVYSGSGNAAVIYGSGYSRDSTNFTSFLRTMAFIYNAEDTNTFKVQHRSDSDLLIGGSVADSCHLQIINISPFAIGMYDDTSDTSTYGLQTWATMPWNNEIVTAGTANSIVMSGDNKTVTLSANTTYLISYGIAFGTGGSRTQRISKANIGSSDIESSFSYAYQRNTANEYADIGSIFVYKTGGSSEELICQAQRGDADVPGSTVRRVSTSGLFIVDVGSGADFYISHDSTGGQDIRLNPTVNIFETVDQTSTSFSATSDTTLEKISKQFVLMGASIFANQSDTGASVRLSRALTFTVDSTVQTVGQSGQYLRGNQGTEDTFDIAMGIVGVFELNDGVEVGVDVLDIGGDGGASANTTSGRCGFWALDINSI